MMDCVVHRERLLEASPPELRQALARAQAADPRAEGVETDIDSACFETHLASCPACLAAAERVVEGLDALDMALDGTLDMGLDQALDTAPDDRSSGVDPAAILERARGAASETGTGREGDGRTGAHGSEMVGSSIGRRGRRPWARSDRLAAALLAAAAVALVFLRPPSGPSRHPPATVAARPTEPDVEAPAGRNVAVLSTDNPDITVLWIF
jgi:hypothetical protein